MVGGLFSEGLVLLFDTESMRSGCREKPSDLTEKEWEVLNNETHLAVSVSSSTFLRVGPVRPVLAYNEQTDQHTHRKETTGWNRFAPECRCRDGGWDLASAERACDSFKRPATKDPVRTEIGGRNWCSTNTTRFT